MAFSKSVSAPSLTRTSAGRLRSKDGFWEGCRQVSCESGRTRVEKQLEAEDSGSGADICDDLCL